MDESGSIPSESLIISVARADTTHDPHEPPCDGAVHYQFGRWPVWIMSFPDAQAFLEWAKVYTPIIIDQSTVFSFKVTIYDDFIE